MKNLAFALFLSIVFLHVQAARAEGDTYYIEVGNGGTPDEAKAEWNAIVAKNKSLLSKLSYYPKAVRQAGNIVTHNQAGPINNKAKADKICNRLFAKGTSCFVIEGIEGAPPSAEESMSSASQSSSLSGFFPWLSDKPAAPPVPAQGKVEVAEAIPVPLSIKNDSAPQNQNNVSPLLPPPVKVSSSDLPPPESARQNTGPGTLTIEPFASDEAASVFWEQIREKTPELTKGLRVRVVRPVLDSGNGSTLSIGPFAANSSGAQFCDSAVKPLNDNLKCSFSGDNSASVNGEKPHGDRYAQRRQQVRDREVNLSPAAIRSGKIYWVEVVSASTEMEASKQFETLKKQNDDLLEGYRASVSSNLGQNEAYTVRVGPLGSSADANELCTQLQSRGITCKVLTNM